MKTYYHIKPTANIDKVLKNGIRAKDGKIFTVIDNDKNILDRIASTQMFLDGSYAVFSIDPAGIHGKITEDDVAEFTAPFHQIIHQDLIEPGFLKLFSVNDLPSIEDQVRKMGMQFGLSENQIQEMVLSRIQIVEFTKKQKSTPLDHE